MDEIREQLKKLDELKFLVNSLLIFIGNSPPLITTDLHYFLDEIKWLRGFLNCMVKFEITFT